jgi:hypothetical protein
MDSINKILETHTLTEIKDFIVNPNNCLIYKNVKFEELTPNNIKKIFNALDSIWDKSDQDLQNLINNIIAYGVLRTNKNINLSGIKGFLKNRYSEYQIIQVKNKEFIDKLSSQTKNKFEIQLDYLNRQSKRLSDQSQKIEVILDLIDNDGFAFE